MPGGVYYMLENVFAGTSSARKMKSTTFHFDGMAGIYFRITLLVLIRSSLPAVIDFKNKTYLAYTSAYEGSSSWKYMQSFSYHINL